jgi:tetratricopeptide (TPR) repeat protein
LEGLPVHARSDTFSYRAGKFVQRQDLATIYSRIGELLRNSGDLTAAVENNRKAVTVMENLIKQTPSADAREALAYAYVTLGDVLGNPDVPNLGDAKAALENYRRDLDIRAKLTAEDPTSKDRRLWKAATCQRVGNMLQATRDTKGALENYQEALAIEDSLAKEYPNDTVYQREVAIDYQLLSMASIDAGDLKAALDFQNKNIAIWEELAKADPRNVNAKSDLSVGYMRMIDVLAKTGDVSVSMEDAAEELAIDEKMLALNPANADAQHNQAVAHQQLGKAHLLLASNTTKPAEQQRRKWQAARNEFQQSLDIWNEIKRKGPLSVDTEKPGEVAAEIAKCEAALK